MPAMATRAGSSFSGLYPGQVLSHPGSDSELSLFNQNSQSFRENSHNPGLKILVQSENASRTIYEDDQSAALPCLGVLADTL